MTKDYSSEKVERLARAMNALAFDAAETDGWQKAAQDLGEARDTLRALQAENEALQAVITVTRAQRDRARARADAAQAEAAEAMMVELTDATARLTVALAEARDKALEEAAGYISRAVDAATSGAFDASDPRINALCDYADAIRAMKGKP